MPENYGHSYSGPMPLPTALAKSINTIPVRLSIAIGDGKPEGRAAPRSSTPPADGPDHAAGRHGSLPIGAAEVTVLDMTAAYAVFANGGYKADPYAAVEVRNSHGDLIYRRDRDGPRPSR